MSKHNKKLLFITWDGPGVTYLESLFLPVFAGLKQRYEVHFMQFTWAEKANTDNLFILCRQQGIRYTACKIYRKPVAVAGVIYSVIKGIAAIKQYTKLHGIDILLPRSTMPALMVLKVAKWLPQIKLVFDADGLPLEERVDFGGLKKSSWQYKYLKGVEQSMIAKADAVLTRTPESIKIHTTGSKQPASKFFVVVNGRDSSKFKPGVQRDEIRQKLGISADALILVYAGSLGPQYCLPGIERLFRHVQKIDAGSYLLILTSSLAYAKQHMSITGIEKQVIIKQVPFNGVPAFLSAADVAIGFRKNYLSMQGVAPIKLGEYLLCGLPVVVSGPVSATLKNNAALFTVKDDNDNDELLTAATWAVNMRGNQQTKNVARQTGLLYFSLEKAIDTYLNALNSIG